MRAPSGISSREAVRVAGAVPALVVVAHDRRAGASRSSGSSSVSPISGCVSTIARSSWSSGPGLSRTRSGIPILPMSWRIAPSRTVSISSRREPEQLRDPHRERGEPLAVAVQVRVARLDRVRERARERRREQPLAQLVAAPVRALERVGDRGLEVGVRERLRDEAGRAARQRLAERLVGAGAGDEHDRAARPAGSRTSSSSSSPERPGHDHVADDEVELAGRRAAAARARRSRLRSPCGRPSRGSPRSRLRITSSSSITRMRLIRLLPSAIGRRSVNAAPCPTPTPRSACRRATRRCRG